MANSLQSRKRARQNTKRHLRNKSQRSSLYTLLKKVQKYFTSAQPEKKQAQTLYQSLTSALDKSANQGLIHKRKAARHKRRYNALLKAMPSA